MQGYYGRSPQTTPNRGGTGETIRDRLARLEQNFLDCAQDLLVYERRVEEVERSRSRSNDHSGSFGSPPGRSYEGGFYGPFHPAVGPGSSPHRWPDHQGWVYSAPPEVYRDPYFNEFSARRSPVAPPSGNPLPMQLQQLQEQISQLRLEIRQIRPDMTNSGAHDPSNLTSRSLTEDGMSRTLEELRSSPRRQGFGERLASSATSTPRSARAGLSTDSAMFRSDSIAQPENVGLGLQAAPNMHVTHPLGIPEDVRRRIEAQQREITKRMSLIKSQITELEPEEAL